MWCGALYQREGRWRAGERRWRTSRLGMSARCSPCSGRRRSGGRAAQTGGRAPCKTRARGRGGLAEHKNGARTAGGGGSTAAVGLGIRHVELGAPRDAVHKGCGRAGRWVNRRRRVHAPSTRVARRYHTRLQNAGACLCAGRPPGAQLGVCMIHDAQAPVSSATRRALFPCSPVPLFPGWPFSTSQVLIPALPPRFEDRPPNPRRPSHPTTHASTLSSTV